MKIKSLTESEENLADLVWEREPIKSSDLVKICEENFQWKKSTTYTILKRVEEKGVLKNENSLVKSCLGKEDYISTRSYSFLERNFGGSLPNFLAAFSRQNRLSHEDIEELEKLIENHKEGD